MKLTHRFARLTERRPQDPKMDGTNLRFETMEHGAEYPDTTASHQAGGCQGSLALDTAGERFALGFKNPRRPGVSRMSLKPSPEVLLALVMGVSVWGAIWGWYGFPRYIEAALVFVALGCIGAFVWKKSQQ